MSRRSCRCVTASTPGSASARALCAARPLGGVIGALTFRSGLRGSYFALVTLAFAEVLRIIASVAPITGAGVGTLINLDLGARAFQFQSRAVFYWVILALVAVSLVIARLIKQSRFGAWLIAVRENEDAAKALGVDASSVKTTAMVISGAMTAAAGCFYAQYFLFVDSGIAYGTWISIEALLTPIIGGVGTVFGPLLGALAVRLLGEGAKMVDRRCARARSDPVWRGACAGHLVYAARPDRRLCADTRMVHAARCAGRSFDQRGGPWLIQWLIRFSSSIASRAASAACWP